MKVYYSNLKVGDKFKLPGMAHTFQRVRGGFCIDHGTYLGPVHKPGDGTNPLRSGVDQVELVPIKDDWSKVIEGIGKRREEEHADLNAKLGEPHIFVPDVEDSRFGTGYWRINGGVVSYRKFVNGFDPMSRHQYTDEFIDMLTNLKGR